MKGLGGLAATRAALDDFRARVKAAGFPDLHLNIVDQMALESTLRVVRGQPYPDDQTRIVDTVADLLAALQVDSSTMYTWAHHLYPMLLSQAAPPQAKPAEGKKSEPFGFADDAAAQPADSTSPTTATGAAEETTLSGRAAQAGVITADYAEYGQRAMLVLDERPDALGVTYFPHVSMGWDGTPRNYSMGIVLNNTPEKWREFLRQTKSWLDQHPQSRGTVTLNSWNEWVEGSYLEPDTTNGTNYLAAVREVFHATTPAPATSTSAVIWPARPVPDTHPIPH